MLQTRTMKKHMQQTSVPTGSVNKSTINQSPIDPSFYKYGFWFFVALFAFIYFVLPSSYSSDSSFEFNYTIDVYETTPASNEVDSSITTI